MKIILRAYHRQRGAAALFIAVILLLAGTLIVLYASKVGIMDQRISGNDARAKQAFAGAEAGLDAGAAQLLTGTVAVFPTTYSNIAAAPYYSGTISASGVPVDSILITATGYADAHGSTSTASVRQKFGYFDIFDTGPDAPVIVAGNVPPQGNMEIVGNPNGAGAGVNVAVWSDATTAISGSSATCQRAEYIANGSETTSSTGDFTICSANSCDCGGVSATIDGIISKSGQIGRDIVYDDGVNDPHFPTDLFAYVFGVPKEMWTIIRDKATQVDDCSGFTSESHGMYWVNGDCDLPGNDVGGANTCVTSGHNGLCSVVIIVGDGNGFSSTGGDTKVYGLVFMFDDSSTADIGRANMGGSTAIYGAFVADHDVCGGSASCFSGSFDVVYERAVFEAIANDKTNQLLARVAGTWIDN
ncbi:MAG: pilus assembly PilX family protein [Gammaproteobacteria bacterium]